MNLKGSLPALILQVLTQGPSHGYEIAQSIKTLSGNLLDFKEGTLYPTLHALEDKTLVESQEDTKNGRTRRLYRLTKKGKAALVKERQAWQQLSGAIHNILGGPA